MLRQSIRTKLIASIGILVISIVSFGLIYFPDRLREQADESFDHELEILCKALALGIGVGLEHNDFESIQKAIDFAKEDKGVQMIRVLDIDQQVIAAFPETASDEFAGLSVGLTRTSDSVAFCSPFYTGEEQYGYVVIIKSRHRIEQAVNLGRSRFLAVGVCILLLCTVVVFFISTMVSKPVNELIDATAKFSRGDYEARVKVSSLDEVGILAESFNEMAETIDGALTEIGLQRNEAANTAEQLEKELVRRKQTEADLQSAQEDLEDRVQARTAELTESYDHLRQEVSERERAEKELEEQRVLSVRSDRLRSLGEMAAGIAHELNQPLVAVRGMMEHLLIAQEKGWDFSRDRLRDKLVQVVDQADRMAHIVNHVRLFAREAGKPELGNVDINEVVTSSIDMLRAQFNSHGVVLDVQQETDVSNVLANAFSLEEVLLNLLSNARHAVEGSSNGSVGTVRVKTKSANRQLGGVGVMIEVSDNGTGIPEEILEKVFDPFFTTKGPDEGTGLGLSVSKSIVETFDGRLQIESTPGEGTVVSVYLPVTEATTGAEVVDPT